MGLVSEESVKKSLVRVVSAWVVCGCVVCADNCKQKKVIRDSNMVLIIRLDFGFTVSKLEQNIHYLEQVLHLKKKTAIHRYNFHIKKYE
jgi:hypothetical protein